MFVVSNLPNMLPRTAYCLAILKGYGCMVRISPWPMSTKAALSAILRCLNPSMSLQDWAENEQGLSSLFHASHTRVHDSASGVYNSISYGMGR